MATTRNSRTLRVYVSDLLEYPRWIIEREVDFTDCSYAGRYNAFLPECVNCNFGQGCRWLDQQRTPDIADAPLDELIQALEGAVEYLQSTKRQQGTDEDGVRDWMREARRFLRSRGNDGELAHELAKNSTDHGVARVIFAYITSCKRDK